MILILLLIWAFMPLPDGYFLPVAITILYFWNRTRKE